MSMLGESSINMWSKNDCRLEFHCECECSVLLQQMVGVNLPIWVYLTVYNGLHLAGGFCPGEVFPLVVGHKVSRAGHSNPFGRPTNLQVLASVIPMFNLSCQLVNRSRSVIRPTHVVRPCITSYCFTSENVCLVKGPQMLAWMYYTHQTLSWCLVISIKITCWAHEIKKKVILCFSCITLGLIGLWTAGDYLSALLQEALEANGQHDWQCSVQLC